LFTAFLIVELSSEWRAPVVLTILLLLAVTASLIIVRVVAGVRYPFLAVVSESMVPTLRVGDVAVVSRVDVDSISTGPDGTIIAFIRPEEPNDIIVHRAYEKLTVGGQVYFRTMGDNNPAPDPWLVPADLVVGRVVLKIPLFGYTILIFKTVPGIAGLIALASAVVLADSMIPMRGGERGSRVVRLLAVAMSAVTVAPYVAQPMLKGLHAPLPWEALSLAAWYALSYLYPRAPRDPRDGLFAWVYHTVTVTLPVASDTAYHLTGITPAEWWFDVAMIGRPFSPVTGSFYVFSLFVSLLISAGLAVALVSAALRRE